VAIALAVVRPRVVGVLALIFIALVPVYAAPELGALELQPSVCAFWLCALGTAVMIIGRDERLSFSGVDAAVGLFAVATLMSVLAGARTPTEWVQNTFYWLGPYLGLRLLIARTRDATWLPRAFVFTAATVVPFAAYEFVSGKNLFLHLNFNKALGAIWRRRSPGSAWSASTPRSVRPSRSACSWRPRCCSRSRSRRRVGGAGARPLARSRRDVPRLPRGERRAHRLGGRRRRRCAADARSTGRVRRVLVGLLGTLAVVMAIATVALPHSPISPLTLFSSQGSSSQLVNSDSWRTDLISNALSGRLSVFGTQSANLAVGSRRATRRSTRRTSTPPTFGGSRRCSRCSVWR